MMTASSLTKQLIKLKRVKLLKENVAKGPKKGLCTENMDVGVKLKREKPKADVGETGHERGMFEASLKPNITQPLLVRRALIYL